ncbi:MAG: ABC-type transporter, integral rane subunit [Firmicutes bacterium]|nr:ABC-type transporter, integral rane subunit [Bacillota bacterium]
MELFQYDFMQRALIAGLITAVACPLIGIFVVVRRQAMIGDGLGHIAFAGVMGGYVLGVYPTAVAALVTMLGAAAIEFVRHRHMRQADTALAIFFYSGIALAVIFSSMAKVPGNGMIGVLFGSILTVTGADIWLIAGSGVLVLGVMHRYFDRLLLMAFDEDVAHVSGINTGLTGTIFSMMAALVVVVGMRVVGILLVSSLMVIPVAAAQLLRRGFRATLALAVAFSVISVLGGLVLSFNLDIAPGGTIVVTAVAIYLIMLVCADLNVNFTLTRKKSADTIVKSGHKNSY